MTQIYACEDSRHRGVTAWRRPPVSAGSDSPAQHMGPPEPRTLKLDALPAACLATSARTDLERWTKRDAAANQWSTDGSHRHAALGTDLRQRHSLQVQLRRTLHPRHSGCRPKKSILRLGPIFIRTVRIWSALDHSLGHTSTPLAASFRLR
jgi:hypothetical protein